MLNKIKEQITTRLLSQIIKITISIAGAIHLILFPEHLLEARGSGLLFITIAITQLSLGILLKPQGEQKPLTINLLIYAQTIPIVIYILARHLPAPFTGIINQYDTLGLTTITLQIVGLISTMLIGYRQKQIKNSIITLILAIMIGATLFITGQLLSDNQFLKTPDGHTHGTEDAH